MLSIFPELLNYQLLGIFIIRVAVGITLLLMAIQITFNKKGIVLYNFGENNKTINKFFQWIFGITSLVVSSFMIIGFLTQISAIISAYLFLEMMFLNSQKTVLGQTKTFYFVLAIICLSFLFLGPGALSIDLPL